MSNIYEMIRTQLSSIVPFANTVGVVLQEIGDGTARASLEQRPETSNHIDTQHAGAMFTLGEAASGAALAGALALELPQLRPVAKDAKIAYVKIAKGKLVAHAQTSRPGSELLSELKANGKVVFDVEVNIRDTNDDTVVEMTVAWHVSKRV